MNKNAIEILSRHGARLTPAVWAELEGIQILDPDGWRNDDGVDIGDKIAFADWDRRRNESTICPIQQGGKASPEIVAWLKQGGISI